MLHRFRLAWLGIAAACLGAPQRASADAAALVALGESLQLSVTEAGPDQPWTLELSNQGSLAIALVADPGLLWFEVTAGERSGTCRLPEPLWPKVARRGSQMVLAPGESFSRTFDARFFCFADLQQRLLVPGARVTPHFGWPPQTAQVRKGGKRVTEVLPPGPPFVAWPAPDAPIEPEPPVEPAPLAAEKPGAPGAADDEAAPDAPPSSAPLDLSAPHAPDGVEPATAPPPSEGLKALNGPALVLSDAYSTWSAPDPASGSKEVHVRMLAGSDAEDDKSVTITVAIVNGTNMPQQLFARRELFDYVVTGPEGEFECNAFEIGPPDFASFSTLAPGASQSMVVRLIEMCPRSGLLRPGIYSVHARFEAQWSGSGLGLEAFTGRLEAQRPALVRVRTGDRSSFLRAANTILVDRSAQPLQAMPPQGEMPMPIDPVPAPEGMPDHEGVVPAEPPPMQDLPVDGAVE